jgi:hypothetical protein
MASETHLHFYQAPTGDIYSAKTNKGATGATGPRGATGVTGNSNPNIKITPSTIGIGINAAYNNQSTVSITIGNFSTGYRNRSTNTIVLNASGSNLPTTTSGATFLMPVRIDPTEGDNYVLRWNSITGEIYASTITVVV